MSCKQWLCFALVSFKPLLFAVNQPRFSTAYDETHNKRESSDHNATYGFNEHFYFVRFNK